MVKDLVKIHIPLFPKTTELNTWILVIDSKDHKDYFCNMQLIFADISSCIFIGEEYVISTRHRTYSKNIFHPSEINEIKMDDNHDIVTMHLDSDCYLFASDSYDELIEFAKYLICIHRYLL